MSIIENYQKSFTLYWIVLITSFAYCKALYCRGDVIDRHGVIQSPGFPQVSDIYDCLWKFSSQEGMYLKLEVDSIQLYFKDTPYIWRPAYTRNICSQSLKIGNKPIDCSTNTKSCYIFRRDPRCSIPTKEGNECYVYNWDSHHVPVRFTSDGKYGYTLHRRADFLQRNYPKGFKLLYSHEPCVQVTTTETTPQTTQRPSTTSQAPMTSLTSTELEMTSDFGTRSKGNTAERTTGIPNAKQQTTTYDLVTNVTFGNSTKQFQKPGLKTHTLIAVIISCLVILLLLIACVIYVIWMKRKPEKSKSTEFNGGPETVYSVAYGRLAAQQQEQGINNHAATDPSTAAYRNPDAGFVYSTVAVRQISNGEHPYVTVGDTYETMPDKSADDMIYSSVTTTPSQDSTTKRKSTFRYQIQSNIAPRNQENATMVENILYQM